ncbi:aldehyde dehydrogenase family protein [Streptomyces sp. NPDC007983]|uniref:aldehyde dehydrogenase family protein n=1 Tax=Streptomyces sp. NPDC007983 TaxID=3364800 RepID=UPI0036EEAC20
MNNVDAPAMVLRYYAGLSRGLEQEETRISVGPGSRTVVRREPIGVAAVIPPWNYPVFLAITKIAPALAAGCTVVFKPSVETSLSGALLVRIAQEAGLSAGIDKVAFTGATSTGRLIGAECGERLIPANLELGGKSAAIVLNDANLEHTLQGPAFLSFLNTGPGRYDRILDGLVEITQQQVIGDPLGPATTTGPLMSARRREKVEQHVALGVAEGARLATGAAARTARPRAGSTSRPSSGTFGVNGYPPDIVSRVAHTSDHVHDHGGDGRRRRCPPMAQEEEREGAIVGLVTRFCDTSWTAVSHAAGSCDQWDISATAVRVPINHPRSSGRVLVLVECSAESRPGVA